VQFSLKHALISLIIKAVSGEFGKKIKQRTCEVMLSETIKTINTPIFNKNTFFLKKNGLRLIPNNN